MKLLLFSEFRFFLSKFFWSASWFSLHARFTWKIPSTIERKIHASCVTNDFSQDTDKMGKNPLLLVFTTSTIQIFFATKPRRINIIERNSSRRLAFFSFFIKAASLFDQRSEKPLTLLPFEDGNARSKC